MSERASWERHRYRSPHPNGWHSAVRPSVRLMVRPAAAAMQRSIMRAGGQPCAQLIRRAGGRLVRCFDLRLWSTCLVKSSSSQVPKGGVRLDKGGVAVFSVLSESREGKTE